MSTTPQAGLVTGDVAPWFQPIVDVGSGRLKSFEALARWIHPTKGVVPPLDFIELAEGSGIIHEIGSTILDLAVGHLADWHASGTVAPDVGISVNISVRQPLSMTFVDAVDATLRRHDVAPQLLNLDLTESIWKRLPHLGGGARYAVAEPERYVDPTTGTVLIRFVNDRNDGVGFSFDMSITGDLK